jgi:hypothetical protein
MQSDNVTPVQFRNVTLLLKRATGEPQWSLSMNLRRYCGVAAENAILKFLRETIQNEWKTFRSQVSDNFRVITHEKFQVLP